MIEISAAAEQKLFEILARKKQDILRLLIEIKGRGPAGFEHNIRFISENEKPEDVIVVEAGKLRFFIERDNADNLKGSTIDFITATGGFQIDDPNPPWVGSDPLV